MANASAAQSPIDVPRADDRIDRRKLLTFMLMVFGMFMAILDIQIVSASLAEIQAGLSASSSEITWVQTSYLIAEVIMIPLSGFLSRAMGTRYLFALSAGGFTFASLMCGLSTSIGSMIFWRAVQGFIGGGMIPTVFATSYTIFPKSKIPVISPMIGLVATLAPTIGPTVGGYLTDALSWHWLFFINVIPGIIVTVAAFTRIDFDQPNWTLLDRFDWTGLLSMAGFLGALEYVLEEGPRNDWFNDSSVFWLTWVSGISAVVFFARVLTANEPIVDIRAFANRNFALGSLFSFMVGIGLYGLTYLYPVYLGQIRGYNALMIGEALFVTGATQFITAPIAGKLMGEIDPRWMMFIGLLSLGLSSYLMTGMTRDWDFWEIFWPQVLRGFGLMFAMIPVNNMALGSLPPERLKNAAGLFNLTRNLGGAVGLAMLATMLNDRTDLHLARLHERFTAAHVPAAEALANLTKGMAAFGSSAQDMALKQLAGIVHRQGVVMAFADVFLVLAILYGGLAFTVCLMRRPAAAHPSGPAAGH